MRYQNASIDKVREVSNVTKRITWIDSNAMPPCHNVYKHIDKGKISISSYFDFPVLHICKTTSEWGCSSAHNHCLFWPVLIIYQTDWNVVLKYNDYIPYTWHPSNTLLIHYNKWLTTISSVFSSFYQGFMRK